MPMTAPPPDRRSATSRRVTPASMATRGTPRAARCRDTVCVLRVEDTGAGHRDHAHLRLPCGQEPCAASSGQRDLRTGRDQDAARAARRSRRAHSRRARCPRSALRCAPGRQGLARQDEARRAVVRARSRRPRPPPSPPYRRAARRPCSGSGAGSPTCSTGWCVGPSSPRPMESCVNTRIDALLHQRRHAQRRCARSRRTPGRCRRTE